MTDNEKTKKQTVLVVEDDKMFSFIVRKSLEQSGFSVTVSENGNDAFKMVRQNKPDLVLLDILIPGMDGFTLCKRLKEDMSLQRIPVIMMTGVGQMDARIKGLEMGADDYIVKPFDHAELVARVRSTLRRLKMDLDANPLTGLPGNNTIQKLVLRMIEQKKTFALLYVDLNQFKAYNDYYGFAKGDDVIRFTGQMLEESVKSPPDFLGHIGGDDFVVVTGVDTAERLCQEIIKRFDTAVPLFYNEEDRNRGTIETVDRRGKKQRYAFLSIAIGVVMNLDGRINSMGMISKISAELKAYAKKSEGSAYAIDRRIIPR